MHNPTTRLGLPVVPDDQAAAIATESGRPSDDILLSTSQSIWVSSSRTSSSSFPRGNGLDGDSNFDSSRLATAPSYPFALPDRHSDGGWKPEPPVGAASALTPRSRWRWCTTRRSGQISPALVHNSTTRHDRASEQDDWDCVDELVDEETFSQAVAS